ncbi:MAG: hypothetical protein QOE70_489 [Chthoniobacter sp.]|nr:hypothetical protein [Chthoniobacter sp.]
MEQIGFAANGQLYYPTEGGGLFGGVGNLKGGYKFALIDANSAAFAVNNVSALLDIRSNGDVWELEGRAVQLPSLLSKTTHWYSWEKFFTGADTGTTVGSQQAGITTGTPPFVLPDG